MQSRRIVTGFAALALLSAIATASAQDKSIVVSSTTSTQDSGLFGHILPLFKAKTGIDVKVVSQGTGQALDTGRRGDADVVFVLAAAGVAGCGSGEGSSATSTERTATEETTTTTSTEETTTAAEKVTVVSVVVVNGAPQGGIVRRTVSKGDRVVLVVKSDVADEIHVHGYDVSTDVTVGGTARLPFTADLPGRFEVELEQRGVQIADLTVR